MEALGLFPGGYRVASLFMVKLVNHFSSSYTTYITECGGCAAISRIVYLVLLQGVRAEKLINFF